MDHARPLSRDGLSLSGPKFRAAELLFQVQLGKETSEDKLLTIAREDFENDETN
jgi:hypothetical protein